MTPSQQHLADMITDSKSIRGGLPCERAADPADREKMVGSVIKHAMNGNGTLNHYLDAVCRERGGCSAREGVRIVLKKMAPDGPELAKTA